MAKASRSKRQYVHGLNSEALRIARSLDGVREGPFPDFIESSLATLAHRPPRGEQWVHEVKYDGYRFQCHIHRDVRFYTRRGYDWSGRLRHLVGAFQGLVDHAVILDGEVIVQTPEGLSDFHALEMDLKAKDGSDRLVYSSSTACISMVSICARLRSSTANACYKNSSALWRDQFV
jgi:ATP-dependent DNA ligase